jgi:hypothetical protein
VDDRARVSHLPDGERDAMTDIDEGVCQLYGVSCSER